MKELLERLSRTMVGKPIVYKRMLPGQKGEMRKGKIVKVDGPLVYADTGAKLLMIDKEESPSKVKRHHHWAIVK